LAFSGREIIRGYDSVAPLLLPRRSRDGDWEILDNLGAYFIIIMGLVEREE
jgi:hypothetical protein